MILSKNPKVKSLSIIGLVTWPYILNDIYIILLNNQSLTTLWLLDIIFYLTIPLFTLIYLNRKGHIEIKDYGWPRHDNYLLQEIIGFFVLAYFVCILFYVVNPILEIIPNPYSFGYGFPESGKWHWLAILYASITAGILEEIIFRGLFVTELSNVISNKFILLFISCIFFGLIHWCQGPRYIIIVSIWAIVPTLLYMKYRFLLPLIISHFGYDFLIFSNII